MAQWRITWGDRSWTEDDLTGQHLATLSLISGDDRFENLLITEDEVRSYPTEGYMRLMFMLATLLAVDAANELNDADEATGAVATSLQTVQQASADEILGALSFD